LAALLTSSSIRNPGEFSQTFAQEDLMKMRGEHFVKFIDLANRHDPDWKFAHEFTRRMFWGK
jgi:hypothetical protein